MAALISAPMPLPPASGLILNLKIEVHVCRKESPWQAVF